MRFVVFANVLVLASSAMALLAGTAAAEESRTAGAAKDDGWGIRAFGAYGMGATFYNGAGGLAFAARAGLAYEESPKFFYGISYRRIASEDLWASSDKFESEMMGSVLEYHPLGRYWADPYLAMDLAYATFRFDTAEGLSYWGGRWPDGYEGNGFNFALGGGFAFRGKHASIGSQVSVIHMPFSGIVNVIYDTRLDLRI